MNIEFSNWKLAKTEANRIANPLDLTESWENTEVPGTVYAHFNSKSIPPPCDMDDRDWWYCGSVTLDNAVNNLELVFSGLAPHTEIWLNGNHIATCDTMFVACSLNATLIAGENILYLCFRSLGEILKQRRTRPKWKPPLLEQQNLRWLRTSLMGRMAGWNKPCPIIGPWAPITCTMVSTIKLNHTRLLTTWDVGQNQARLKASVQIQSHNLVLQSAVLNVCDSTFDLQIKNIESQLYELSTQSVVIGAEPWWPHTQGEPMLYEAVLILEWEDKSKSNFKLGPVGFKSVELITEAGTNQFVINGQKIFCRGSVWTPQDAYGFSNKPERLRNSLSLAKASGINMFRINGTMNYESKEFFALCDELGILIWQDFMFANMDYPMEDASFSELVNREIQFQLARTSRHVCIAAYCGSNEAYMQAAMLGIAEDNYKNVLFDKLLPDSCEEMHPGIPYMEGSPCGGDLPFQPDVGTSHYYGVSAYMQDLNDAETSQVKFASECLAFSNIPEPSAWKEIYRGKLPYTHDPLWKQGVPRMAGTGWDFEDVRDHYLKSVYGVDPIELRYKDTPRYLELSRVITGDIMTETIALWRSHYTACAGALTWFWQDLHAGAGWGLLDHQMFPKAAYFAFKRASQPVSAFLIPRGLNGLFAVTINDTNKTKNVTLEIKGFNSLDVQTFDTQTAISLAPCSQQKISVDKLIGHFTDLPHTFRFGPIQHRVVFARLLDQENSEMISEQFYFPQKSFLERQKHPQLTIGVDKLNVGEYELRISGDTLLQWLRLDIPEFQVSDNYFHLAPGQQKRVRAFSKDDVPLKGYIEAVNLRDSIRIACK